MAASKVMGVHHHTGDTAGGQNHKTAEVRDQSHEEGRTNRTGVAGEQVGEGTGNMARAGSPVGILRSETQGTQTGAALSEDGQASKTNQQVQRYGGGGTLTTEDLRGDVNAEGLNRGTATPPKLTAGMMASAAMKPANTAMRRGRWRERSLLLRYCAVPGLPGLIQAYGIGHWGSTLW